MPKLKAPLLSLEARGRLGKLLSLARRGGRNILERRPIPVDARSSSQLFNRHMFTKCVDLWHLLSEAEKQEWESSARSRHMTGYAWYISQCLRPNPGIYLPLQGGNMQGNIDMDTWGIEDLPDPTNPQDADTLAARDAAIAAALADCIDSHIHGWDGSDWQKLKVESAVHHNLRVALFSGTKDIGFPGLGDLAVVPSDFNSLPVNNFQYLWSTVNAGFVIKTTWRNPDANSGDHFPSAGLFGYNGALWDRLRTYGVGILKVGRAEIGLSTLRRVAVGQVKAAAGNLYWIALNPSAGNSAIELTDDLDGLGAIVFDHFDTARDGHMMTLDPPMEFSNGIYLKTLTNMTSVIFGYK